MFQYAVGRSLSLRLQTEFKLDISEFDGYSLHQGFELDRVFGINTHLAAEREIRELLGWQSVPLIQRLVARLAPGGRLGRMVCEPHYHYWPGIRNISGDCYLSGYWQSGEYFSEIEAVIRKDFSFKSFTDDKNRKLADKIQSVHSVSLHVRRGDYVASAKTNAMHGTCSLDYYRQAIDYINRYVEGVYFFVFSDDIPWVKENLMIPRGCQFVYHNQGQNSFRDMQLMSLCKHHIIANSTFSWWGAWLDAEKTKVVIAPERWFGHDNYSTKNLYPSGWVVM